jgi:hypothetical protein
MRRHDLKYQIEILPDHRPELGDLLSSLKVGEFRWLSLLDTEVSDIGEHFSLELAVNNGFPLLHFKCNLRQVSLALDEDDLLCQVVLTEDKYFCENV